MNSPELNNYIQYVTRSGIVKAKSVVFLDNGINTTFEVAGIIEDFFIFAVFQNNLQRFGIGFENFDNVNMLSFINSSIVDLACVPTNSFLLSEQVVTMSYNNEYVKNFSNPVSDPLEFPAVQVVSVNNFPVVDGGVSVKKPDELVYVEYFLSQYFPNLTLGIHYTIKFINESYNGCQMSSLQTNYLKAFYVKYPFTPGVDCVPLTKTTSFFNAENSKEKIWVWYDDNAPTLENENLHVSGYVINFVAGTDVWTEMFDNNGQ